MARLFWDRRDKLSVIREDFRFAADAFVAVKRALDKRQFHWFETFGWSKECFSCIHLNEGSFFKL